MPLPNPSKGESKDKFISRFMSNETMKREFSDQKQRVAVAHSQWRKKQGGEKPKGKSVLKRISNIPLSFRKQEKEFYSEGFVATTHPDRYKEEGYDGTAMSRTVLESIRDSINSGKTTGINGSGNPRIVGMSHTWIENKDVNEEPVGVIVPPSDIRETGDGQWGVYATVHHNKNHPDFETTKYNVEHGYIPGYSFEFVEGDSTPLNIDGRNIKFIENINDFVGISFVTGREIANEEAVIKEFGYRKIEAEFKKNKEAHKMAEDEKKEDAPVEEKKEEVKTEEAPVEEEKKEEVTKPAEEKKKGEETRNVKISERKVADLVMESKPMKDALSELKVRKKPVISKESNDVEVKVRAINKAMVGELENGRNPATPMMGEFISHSFDDYANGNYAIPCNSTIQVRCVGKGMKIVSGLKARATLDTATNTGTYSLSSVEFPDLFAPGILDTFNTQTNLFGFARKEQHIGGLNYMWKMILDKDPESNATFVDRDDVTVQKQYSGKGNFSTPLKFARRGVSVADTTLRYSTKSLGDLFQLELDVQMTYMMKTVNIALFSEKADADDNSPLGLEAVADGVGKGTLYGRTRSIPNRLLATDTSNTYESITTSISEARLRESIDYLETEGCNFEDLAIVTSPTGRSYLFNLIDTNKRPHKDVDVDFGFSRKKVATFDGMPIIVDSDCQSTLATNTCLYFIDTTQYVIIMAMEPRIISLAKVGAGTEAYIEMHFAPVYKQPRRISMIDGIDGPAS